MKGGPLREPTYIGEDGPERMLPSKGISYLIDVEPRTARFTYTGIITPAHEVAL